MDWHVAPDGLRDTLIELNRTYAPREIVVTENGAAYPDTVDQDGRCARRGPAGLPGAPCRRGIRGARARACR